MGWMNILVECMLLDEFYPLWINFNNQFSSVINEIMHMGWMNFLVKWMLMDEFYPLWKNFNNEFSSVINKNHANGLNEFLHKNGCWWMKFIFYECFINDDAWTSSTMNGNQINAKSCNIFKRSQIQYFWRSWIIITYKMRDKKMELMTLWFMKVLHYFTFFTL
jgi:hypothetical protein